MRVRRFRLQVGCVGKEGKMKAVRLPPPRSLEPREVPAYRISEVAQYLRMPKATVRAWALGQGDFKPVLRLEAAKPVPLLSFVNLVEVHVLDALRREHDIPLQRTRGVLRILEKLFPGESHPLADRDLLTEAGEVFVDHLGRLVSASRDGQIAIREVLEAHLRRVDRDPAGRASRLYPFTRKRQDPQSLRNEPRLVMIDPEIQFGRPVLTGTGIPTLVIADRYKAGESIADLARDYDRPEAQIEEAIRCELALPTAA
jgi:uncharacterized protein (DUF433 family)